MLATNLKYLLKTNKVSINELARKTQVPKTNILSWLAGSNPQVSQLHKVAQFFSVSLDFLVAGEKNEMAISSLATETQDLAGRYEVIIKKIDPLLSPVTAPPQEKSNAE